METEQALGLIQSVLNHNELRLSKGEHVLLEQAYTHIESELNEASDEHLETDQGSE